MQSINNLYKKKNKRIIGLMSGTSLDGLDLVDVSIHNEKSTIKIIFHSYNFFPYSKEQRQQILTAMKGKPDIICQIHYDLGKFFAACVNKYFLNKKLDYSLFDLIASHGQTIYHLGGKSTLQIGEADTIAYLTKIPVIFDFRAIDIVSGGQGAPLMPYFDQYLQNQLEIPALFLNLGGIANFSFIDEKKGMISSDTGPANILLNLLVEKYTDGKMSYDKDGKLAKKGKIDNTILKELLKHPFLNLALPKSCGHEEFGENFLETILVKYKRTSFENLLHTLTAFSASSIAQTCLKYLKSSNSIIIVSGGGVNNPLLMHYLSKYLAPFKVENFNKLFDYDGKAKEAVAFAYFAYEKFNQSIWQPLTKKSFGKLAFPYT